MSNEQPRSPLDEGSEEAWATVPELIHADCESYLLSKLPPDLLAKWKDQHSRGVSIGSDEGIFHFGGGVWVRNILREQLTDAELPRGDWDDYYMGALAAVVAKAAGSGPAQAPEAKSASIDEETPAERERLLAPLLPWKRKLVEECMANHPGLTARKAIEMLTAFGGL